MTWSVSNKYRDQLPSQLVRLVRDLVSTCRDAQERMSDVILEKKRLVNLKNVSLRPHTRTHCPVLGVPRP